MPTPSIQTLRTDAQQVLNLDSISAVRSVVAATLANANAGTPLNPNLTTQQLWNEFYQIVTQPKSDIESIIANQLMKFMYAPPAPGGVGGNQQVIYNDNGVLAGDTKFLWDDALNKLDIDGSATISGDLTVDTSTLKVDSTNNRVGIGTATPATILHIQDASTLYQTIQTASGGAGTNYKRTGSTGATDWLVGHGAASASNKFEIFNSGSSGFEITSNNQLRYAISTLGVHTWEYVGGVAGTAMTLNSTGLGVFNSPVAALDVYKVANDTINRTNATFCFGQIAGLGAALLGQQSASAPYQFNLQAANAANSVQFPLVLQPSGGNVGIGVTPSVVSGQTRVELKGSNGAGYVLRSGSTNTAARDWVIAANVSAFGDFVIRQGNSQGAEPNSGTDRFYIDPSGNTIFTISSTPPTLSANSQLTVNATSNTNLRFSYRGSDGVTRVANLTLA